MNKGGTFTGTFTGTSGTNGTENTLLTRDNWDISLRECPMSQGSVPMSQAGAEI